MGDGSQSSTYSHSAIWLKEAMQIERRNTEIIREWMRPIQEEFWFCFLSTYGVDPGWCDG